MKIAIRGCKSLGDLLIKRIDRSLVEIVCVVDLNVSKWGEEIDGIPIVSPMKAYELFEENVFEKVVINPLLGVRKITDIFEEMKTMGFPHNSIIVPKVRDIYEKEFLEIDSFLGDTYEFDNFKTLYYLEYHIADECNLNCSSCSHFSPLVRDKYYPEVDQIAADLKKLTSIVDHIEWIRVMGGEPFLNKDWIKYLQITREIWPFSKISIVTNGILLKNLSKEEKEEINRLDVWIDISLYQPLWKKIDEIIVMLKEEGMHFEVNGNPIFEFTSVFDLNSKDNYVNKRKECSAPCNNLYKGKMTPCPIMMYTPIFNKYFNLSLPEGQPIDLYGDELDYKALVNLLKKPMPICKYCNMKQNKKWKIVNEPHCKVEDWVVKEE